MLQKMIRGVVNFIGRRSGDETSKNINEDHSRNLLHTNDDDDTQKITIVKVVKDNDFKDLNENVTDGEKKRHYDKNQK